MNNLKAPFMKRGSTHFLRSVIFIIGIGVLALYVLLLVVIGREMVDVMPVQYELLAPIFIMTASLIPLYGALYQALKLLGYIDRNEAFSELSVKALKNIKHNAIAISLLYLALMPLIFVAAQADDAPGLVLVGIALAFSPLVIAVFAAILQRLLQGAIDIKSENDLTV